MNPVTQGLLAQLNEPSLATFAQNWDDWESLIIEIYRQKTVSFAQQERFFVLREALQPEYAALAAELGQFWPHVRIKGESLTTNPFEALLVLPAAKQVVENWTAMRYLPAAREAINQLLMGRIENSA